MEGEGGSKGKREGKVGGGEDPLDLLPPEKFSNYATDAKWPFQVIQGFALDLLPPEKFSNYATDAKWPFKVIQGHVFWSQWKGDQGLSNTK